jgi:hypothetical protein
MAFAEIGCVTLTGLLFWKLCGRWLFGGEISGRKVACAQQQNNNTKSK